VNAAELARIELSMHWNGHNHEECSCDQPPVRCESCSELFPHGSLTNGFCKDCMTCDFCGRHHPGYEAWRDCPEDMKR
jgi:hypothetical protein